MKNSLIAIFILFSITPGIYSQCRDFYLKFDNSEYRLDATQLGENCYVSLSSLNKAMMSAAFSDEIRRISSQNGSFYALIETEENLYIIQMNVPSISRKSELLIPISSFFNSLDALKIFNFEISDYIIDFRDKSKPRKDIDMKPLKRNGQHNFLLERKMYDEAVSTMRVLQDKIRSFSPSFRKIPKNANLKYIDSTGNRPPTEYSIPSSLKQE